MMETIETTMTGEELVHGAYSLSMLLAYVLAYGGIDPEEVTADALHNLRQSVMEHVDVLLDKCEYTGGARINLAAVNEYAQMLLAEV